MQPSLLFIHFVINIETFTKIKIFYNVLLIIQLSNQFNIGTK